MEDQIKTEIKICPKFVQSYLANQLEILKTTYFGFNHLQCDQIGRFLKVLTNKFLHKRSPNILGLFWAINKNNTL